MIGPGFTDRPDQLLEVESALDEMAGEGVQQIRIGGRVGPSHVVFRFHQTASHEMFPVTVHQHAGKEGVVLVGDPIRQDLPRVLLGGDVEGFRPQSGGHHRKLGLGINGRRRSAIMENDLFPGLSSGLACQASKEGGKPVVILLAPSFVGMVMAAGALQSNAQKDLGCVLNLVLDALDLSEPGHGRIAAQFPGSRHNLSHPLVVGLVFHEALTDPGVEQKITPGGPLVPPFIAQDGIPFVGEIVGVLRTRQQPINPFLALGRIRICQEFPGLAGGGQATSDVDRRSAQKGGIVAEFRRWQLQGSELAEHPLVDEAFSRRPVLYPTAIGDRHAKDRHLVLESHHDR